ncbi:hypothetical protein [Luteimonas vadosa]|uniref:EF-hand domain-containing protein n=1 Tax=Luteimonas vadosa TaxID=1165507 RepID=A0ABP9DUL1_9GAMM
MNAKTPLLFALLVPGILALAACDRADAPADDAATAPVATPPVEALPDDTQDTAGLPPGVVPPEEATGDVEIADSGMTFAQLDANGDGGVTMDELAPTEMLHAHFSVADADGNGSLSQAEITKHRADMAADEPRG